MMVSGCPVIVIALVEEEPRSEGGEDERVQVLERDAKVRGERGVEHKAPEYVRGKDVVFLNQGDVSKNMGQHPTLF